MIIPNQQGLYAGVAVLVSAIGLSGCGGETVASRPQDGAAGFSGSEAGAADAAIRCPEGALPGPPSGTCSPVGLQCEAVVYCPDQTTLQSGYSCQCDPGGWSCTMTMASLIICPMIDGGLAAAENTPDGLSPLPANEAAGLKDASVCRAWSPEPDGGAACDFTVPTPPAGQIIDKVVIMYDDGVGNSYQVLPNTSAACDRGWQFTDSTHTLIHVCQITCDLIRANPQAKISLLFGCMPPF